MVNEIGAPGMRVHLDTACVCLAGGAIAAAVAAVGDDLAHFHIAEPHLANFEAPAADHASAAAALHEAHYSRWLAIEMREQPEAAIEAAIRFARATYGAAVENTPAGRTPASSPR